MVPQCSPLHDRNFWGFWVARPKLRPQKGQLRLRDAQNRSKYHIVRHAKIWRVIIYFSETTPKYYICPAIQAALCRKCGT